MAGRGIEAEYISTITVKPGFFGVHCYGALFFPRKSFVKTGLKFAPCKSANACVNPVIIFSGKPRADMPAVFHPFLITINRK